MKIGFTGHKGGMTSEQRECVRALFVRLSVVEFHHGCCIGSDADAHYIACGSYIPIVGHPPIETSKMMRIMPFAFKTLHVPKPYLERNHDIVDETDLLFATPRGFKEELRSGTWATIRYARRVNRSTYIIWPSGKINGKLAECMGYDNSYST